MSHACAICTREATFDFHWLKNSRLSFSKYLAQSHPPPRASLILLRYSSYTHPSSLEHTVGRSRCSDLCAARLLLGSLVQSIAGSLLVNLRNLWTLVSHHSFYTFNSMSSSKYGKGSSSSASRNLTFFVPGNGIDREVISTDICRYLGNDATAKPGEYTVSLKHRRLRMEWLMH